MIEASLTIDVPSRSIASSLVKAIGPDNLNMQGLEIKTKAGKSRAKIEIVFDGKIETFISILDDLLQCLQAAKDTITSITDKVEKKD